MSTSSTGADYLRPPKRSGTKEEVLDGLFEHLGKTLGTSFEAEIRDDRLERKINELHSLQVWQDNFSASFNPGWQIVGPVKPHYTDDRTRTYRGRYGHVRSD